MKCDNCKIESQWLEIVGGNFICHKCINKHKIMGLVLRTHMDTFRSILKKLKVVDYSHLMQLTRKDIENVADLKKYGVNLKTSNVVYLD